MKKKVIFKLLGGILVALFVFGLLIGSFDFTRSKKIGKTDYSLVDGCPPGTNYWGLYHKDRLEGVIGGCVKDIYWNERYILAKTHYGANSDSIEGYYIIEMLPPVKKGVHGKKGAFCQLMNMNKKSKNYILMKKRCNILVSSIS